MNNDSIPTSQKAISALYNKYGLEAYEILGIADKKDDIMTQFQKRYDAALAAGANADDLFEILDQWLIEIGAERLD